MRIFRLLSRTLFLSLSLGAYAILAQSPAATEKPSFFTKDMTIYVSDFELDAQDVQVDQVLL